MTPIGILTWLMVVLYEYHKKDRKIDRMRALKVGVLASVALTATTLYSLGTISLEPVLMAAVMTTFVMLLGIYAFLDIVCQYLRQKYDNASTMMYALYVGGLFAVTSVVISLIGDASIVVMSILTAGAVGAGLFYLAETLKLWEMLSDRIPQLQ